MHSIHFILNVHLGPAAEGRENPCILNAYLKCVRTNVAVLYICIVHNICNIYEDCPSNVCVDQMQVTRHMSP